MYNDARQSTFFLIKQTADKTFEKYKGIMKEGLYFGGCVCVCVIYMEVGNVLPIQGLVDRQLSRNGVDDEDASGGLVSPGACHAVSQGAVLIMVWSNLQV